MQELWEFYKDIPYVINGDNFLIDMWYYKDVISNDLVFEKWKDNFFYSRTHKIKWADEATYRMINYWSELWILNDNRDNNNWWRKFCIVDAIWLTIVIYLREIWFSKDLIIKVKNDFYRNNKVIELNIVKVITWEHIRCIVTNTWKFYFADNIDINHINNSLLSRYYTISLTDIVSKIFWKNFYKKRIISIPVSEKDFWLIKTIALANNWDEVHIKTKNWRISKYKKIDKSSSIKIKNYKQTTLKELSQNYKNSKIIVYTNDSWITWIVVEQ